MCPLYPVILPIAHQDSNGLTGREKVKLLQKIARHALLISAQKSGVILGTLAKDKRGAPVPSQGIYWSLSHKTRCVAAVVSRKKIGIDVEEIQPRRSRDLFNYLASEDEWRLSPEPDWNLFFRYWTAKEAATKATGVGLKDLRVCKVVSIADDRHLILHYKNRIWIIEHYFYSNHIISLVTNNQPIQWVIDRWP